MERKHPRSNTPLEQILASGGDTRLALDPRTGLNKFGGSPLPRPSVISLGSSTASTISAHAFAQIEEEHCLLQKPSASSQILDTRMQTLRQELKDVLGLGATSTEVVFSPSGTDSVLHALFVTRCRFGMQPLDCILVAADETGTGIPQALAARHFSAMTAEGVPVAEGEAIAGIASSLGLRQIPIRQPTGQLRPAEDVETEMCEAIRASVYAGRRVLLQVMDCSKLGARSPRRQCLEEIRRQFGDAVQIVVDACQMRISPRRLRWHLSQGHLALISGSKFYMGPSFSGALLVPPTLNRCLSRVTEVPDGLRDYTSALAWPRDWHRVRAGLPDRASLGQYYRWRAALTEMQAYHRVPVEFRQSVLARFAVLAAEEIGMEYPLLRLWQDTREAYDGLDDAEMAQPTIFPVLVYPEEHPLSPAHARVLHAALQRDMSEELSRSLTWEQHTLAGQPCQIGQPAQLLAGSDSPAGALRVCAGARTILDVWERFQTDPHAIHLEEERADLRAIIAKIRLLAHALPRLVGNAGIQHADGKTTLELTHT